MNIVGWVMIGLIGGWIVATFAKHSSSNLIDFIFGLSGSLVGAFVASSFFGIATGSVYTFIAAACGAVIFIFLGRLRAISK